MTITSPASSALAGITTATTVTATTVTARTATARMATAIDTRADIVAALPSALDRINR